MKYNILVGQFKVVKFPKVKPQFTLSELRRGFEKIFKREIDKRNFEKYLRRLGLIKAKSLGFRKTSRKPARLHELTVSRKTLKVIFFEGRNK